MNNDFKTKNCSFCNKELVLSLDKHYIVSDTVRLNPFEEATHYDVVDCNNCGRQNIMGKRYIKIVKKVEDIDE